MKPALDYFIEFLPEYVNDIRTNLAAVLTPEGSPGLTENQILGAALAAGYATRQNDTAQGMEMLAKDRLSAEEIRAAKIAACLMAMNNMYYRFVHLTGDPDFDSMPTHLKMSALAASGIKKDEFETFLLSVSVSNGCDHCVKVHTKRLIEAGMSKQAVQSVARIASVVNAAAQAKFIAETSR